MAPRILVFLAPFLFLLLVEVPLSSSVLDAHYYDQICPQADKIIFETLQNASMHDPKVPARILRMFFHDCFIRVGSITYLFLLIWNNLNFLSFLYPAHPFCAEREMLDYKMTVFLFLHGRTL